MPCPTFEDALAAIQSGEADLGMIPIENSIAGRVADIHHLLPHANLHIVGEHFLPIHFNLMAPKGATLKTVKSVESHIHALGQCRRFIRKHGYKAVIAADTAGAARHISETSDVTRGALAPKLAAKIYGLDVLAENVEDEEHNTTRFVMLSREEKHARPSNGLDRHDLRVPGAQPAGRALQGAGRFRHQRRQHDQARKLHDRGQFLRHHVLCRRRGPSGGSAARARARGARILLAARIAEDPRRLSGAPVPLDFKEEKD